MEINIKDYFKIDDSHSKIRGFIFAYENGKLVFHKENMITEGGRKLIFNNLTNTSAFSLKELVPKVGSGTTMTTPSMIRLVSPFNDVEVTQLNISCNDNNLCAIYDFKVTLSNDIEPDADGYSLVTSELDDWSGEYLIVYSDGPYCFNGSLDILDKTQNYKSVTINNNNTILYSDENYNCHFKIEKLSDTDGTYSIKSASGYYIGANSSSQNELDTSNTNALPNKIHYENGNCIISADDESHLQFYSTSGQERFRYYDGKKNKPIQLYKRNKSRETVSDYSTKISELGLFYKETMFSRVVFQPYTLTHETTLEFKYYIYF